MCLEALLRLFSKLPVQTPPIQEVQHNQQLEKPTQITNNQQAIQEDDIMKKHQIIQVKNFTNYVKKQTEKKSIVIHGTYGGTAQGAIAWLNGQAGRNVAVHYVIGQDAKIHQLIPQKFYAYHAGANFRTISQHSFGIQIVNWLNLKNVNGTWRSWTNKEIQPNRIVQKPAWRGATHFHTITEQQHQALQYLLKYLCQKYNIRKKFFREYDPNAGFNTKQFSGILQHSSFSSYKMDFQPSIIPRISI